MSIDDQASRPADEPQGGGGDEPLEDQAGQSSSLGKPRQPESTSSGARLSPAMLREIRTVARKVIAEDVQLGRRLRVLLDEQGIEAMRCAAVPLDTAEAAVLIELAALVDQEWVARPGRPEPDTDSSGRAGSVPPPEVR